MNPAFRKFRAANNEAARECRARALRMRKNKRWLLRHPDLSPAQRLAADRFLLGSQPALEPRTVQLLRQHLLAKRAHQNKRIRALLAVLDAHTGDNDGS